MHQSALNLAEEWKQKYEDLLNKEKKKDEAKAGKKKKKITSTLLFKT